MLLTFSSGFKSWQWPALWLPLAQCDLPVLRCVTLQRTVCVWLLGWSDPELYFQENVPLGENMALNQFHVPGQPLTCHGVISHSWMFLALLWGVRHWLPLSLQEALSHLTFLSPPADFPYFCNCSTLLVILSDSSLLFQYLLCAAGHLCPALPLAVDVPSALPVSFLILGWFSQNCPVCQPEFPGAGASVLLWTAVHLFHLHCWTQSFLGLCIPSQVLLFPCGVPGPSLSHTQSPVLPRVTSHWFLCSFLPLCLDKPPFPQSLFRVIYKDCFCSQFYLLRPSPCLPPVLPQNTAYLLPVFISFSRRTDLYHVCLRTFWPAFLCFSLSCSFWHARNTI